METLETMEHNKVNFEVQQIVIEEEEEKTYFLLSPPFK